MNTPPTVLIVDDDRMMAKTLADILRLKHYIAEIAHSGSEALARVQQNGFDCVISDIKMPDMNGVELCRRIKQANPDLPVILMTAYSEETLIRQGKTEGASVVLTKPVKIDVILKFLTEFNG